jgi:hypothetical protein
MITSLFSFLILLAHLLVLQSHLLVAWMQYLDLLTKDCADRMMIIAGGISMMYLQTVVFVDKNIYAAICAINVDFKIIYVSGGII